MKISEMADIEKVDFLTENYLILQVSLFKYLFEKYGEAELRKYISGIFTEDFGVVKLGNTKKKVLQGISKISPSFALQKGVEILLTNQTSYEKPKYLEIIEDLDEKKVVHIKKCNQKVIFNKIAKKLGFPEQLTPEAICKYRCTPMMMKLMDVVPRFKGSIEYLESGCKITFSIEK